MPIDTPKPKNPLLKTFLAHRGLPLKSIARGGAFCCWPMNSLPLSVCHAKSRKLMP